MSLSWSIKQLAKAVLATSDKDKGKFTMRSLSPRFYRKLEYSLLSVLEH